MITTQPAPAQRGQMAGGRHAWVDLARAAAILGVIAIHVSTGLTQGYDRIDPQAWWVGNLTFSFTRWPVALFVMVSGMLVLTPPREPMRVFYRRRLARIGLPLLAWSLFYWAFSAHVRHRDGLGVEWFLRATVLGQTYFHLYFLFIMLGLAAVTPFLRVVVAHTTRTQLAAAAAAGIGYAAVTRTLLELGLAHGSNGLQMFIPWLGFYLAGAALRDLRPSRRLVAGCAAAFAAAGVATAAAAAWLQAAYDGRWVGWLYSYFSPTAIAATLAAFVLLKAVPDRWADRRPLALAGAVSLGVYLAHPAVMTLTNRFFTYPKTGVDAAIFVVGKTLALALLTGMLVWLMRLLPPLRRIT